ncbi:YgaP family membrane protein [Alicyclobacillus fodiniaquatilis]|uniref:DUF2892 domain-containing protein n=1 Tax=Alicyclobacillus fodiniaquatilis TaxID=1661150 RepID=A0ABW4JMW6_9BACL
MQQNIGTADRYMRMFTGILAIGCATTRRRRHSPFGNALLLSFGAMKVAESVTGWCPLQYVSQTLSCNMEDRNKASAIAPLSPKQSSAPKTCDQETEHPPQSKPTSEESSCQSELHSHEPSE